jgi:hypothetical protein
MPAKSVKKKSKVVKAKSAKVVKKSAPAPVRRTEVEPFYSDPKNLMVIGAVMVLFLVVVMLISGGAGMTY